MKYCLDYIKNGDYLDKADELTIIFNREDTSLFDFLQKRKNQRVNIYIEDSKGFLENNDIDTFLAMKQKDPTLNFVFKLGKYHEAEAEVKKIYNQIVRSHFRYFFETFISNWDMLIGYISLGPTDIYVVEELGFELDKVSKILHAYNINVRAFPNIAQSNWSGTKSLKKFFIRPDDVDIYEKYVDTLEFLSSEKQKTYYEIYAIDKKWFGLLNEIIIGFKEKDSIDNRFIVDCFAERRIKCGKRCFKGGSCNLCDSIDKLADTLKKEASL